jgi:hypothetical protein
LAAESKLLSLLIDKQRIEKRSCKYSFVVTEEVWEKAEAEASELHKRFANVRKKYIEKYIPMDLADIKAVVLVKPRLFDLFKISPH